MNWTLALPEILLAAAGLVLLLAGVIPKRDTTFPVTMGTLGALLIAAVLVMATPDGMAFGTQFVSDGFARFAKVLILLGAASGLMLALDWNEKQGIARFEFPILVLFSTIGMMVMVSAADLITLYMGLELLSLSLYVIAAFDRDNARSAEAGLKYFVLGALASGLYLYGASLTYGFSGSTSFAAIGNAATGDGAVSLGLLVGVTFVIAALAFKISAVPFHMWTPDVYEGAPTPVTAFFASAPKVAAVSLLVRVLADPFAELAAQWQGVIYLASLGSMLLGSFAALRQNNIKRLMAYSSIGHVGYALMGLAVATDTGLRGVMLYMAIYLVMNAGVFAVLVSMRRQGRALERVEDLAGLGRTDPAMAVAMVVFMFSMAGIPPLAGFFSKLYVFLAAVQEGYWVLATLGVLTSVVSAYYYLRIIKVMYFDAPEGSLDPRPAAVSVVLAASGLFNVLFFLFPAPIVAAATAAVAALAG
ncbi:NADH-quinone oxidoreductase subunit NuoN [Roseomonas sp. SSH11]|uniref:NADH-quinone oxidoreductase subunit N n=1 Tax=Pararoseomonas baculiformis TaxID=2820812 RepID=A0ABS4AF89_9PROT|nr:NADH-quinone oxidoreductase subunit NuoN [Pararoseomonas baculiformis]MBP0445677.1 NADH-quinone oxidoreductase subunit NuoN [Pararoseomonas baculiformis]